MLGDAPTFGPGEEPAVAQAPREPSRITYLRDNTTGKKFVWSAILAERDGMVALDQYENIVPNAPMSGPNTVVDPSVEMNPAINGVAQQSDVANLQRQIRTLADEVAQLRTQMTQQG